MKTMTVETSKPRRRTNLAMKNLLGKKYRMMMNHNVHVITPHGKVMVGRKGRKT